MSAAQIPVVITAAAHHMLVAAAGDEGRGVSGGEQLADGRWRVLLDADVVEALATVHADPSLAIIAVCDRGLP